MAAGLQREVQNDQQHHGLNWHLNLFLMRNRSLLLVRLESRNQDIDKGLERLGKEQVMRGLLVE